MLPTTTQGSIFHGLSSSITAPSNSISDTLSSPYSLFQQSLTSESFSLTSQTTELDKFEFAKYSEKWEQLVEEWAKFVTDEHTKKELNESKEIAEICTRIGHELDAISPSQAHNAEIFLKAIEKIFSSVRTLASQKEFTLSLALVGNGMGAVFGVVMLIKLGFHMHHSQSYEIEELHGSLDDLKKNIEDIKKLINEKIVGKLGKISSQLHNINRILSIGFSEAALMHLGDILNNIDYHIRNDTPLNEIEINKYINKLMNWIKNISKYQTQTGFFDTKGVSNTAYILEILANEKFNLRSQFYPFLIILNNLVPNLLGITQEQINDVPNM